MVHLDVMDGRFVPNLTIGPPVVASIRGCTRLPLDVHLMMARLERFLTLHRPADWLGPCEADVHLTDAQPYPRPGWPGIALNPAIPPLEERALADFVLPDGQPGFGGQFIPSMLKIDRLREMIVSNGYRTRIEVDGGIGPDNLADVLGAGADIIVAGSAVFGHPDGASAGVAEMKGMAAGTQKGGVGRPS